MKQQTLGATIAALRKERGMTQLELASWSVVFHGLSSRYSTMTDAILAAQRSSPYSEMMRASSACE